MTFFTATREKLKPGTDIFTRVAAFYQTVVPEKSDMYILLTH